MSFKDDEYRAITNLRSMTVRKYEVRCTIAVKGKQHDVKFLCWADSGKSARAQALAAYPAASTVQVWGEEVVAWR